MNLFITQFSPSSCCFLCLRPNILIGTLFSNTFFSHVGWENKFHIHTEEQIILQFQTGRERQRNSYGSATIVAGSPLCTPLNAAQSSVFNRLYVLKFWFVESTNNAICIYFSFSRWSCPLGMLFSSPYSSDMAFSPTKVECQCAFPSFSVTLHNSHFKRPPIQVDKQSLSDSLQK
jgi:hypothetical protein